MTKDTRRFVGLVMLMMLVSVLWAALVVTVSDDAHFWPQFGIAFTAEMWLAMALFCLFGDQDD